LPDDTLQAGGGSLRSRHSEYSGIASLAVAIALLPKNCSPCSNSHWLFSRTTSPLLSAKPLPTVVNLKHPPGPPMTLANMCELGVRNLIAYCHNDGCGHQGPIDVSGYPDDIEVPSFQTPGQMRQVRRQARQRAAELERAAATPDQARLAMIRVRHIALL
jgi:hypothetical protein